MSVRSVRFIRAGKKTNKTVIPHLSALRLNGGSTAAGGYWPGENLTRVIT